MTVALRKIAFSLVILGTAGSAHAESSAYKPCTKSPTSSDIEGAKGLHLAAKQYLAKGEFKRAIETWTQAYGFDCTRPEVFINIGKSYEGLGDTARAAMAYRTYVERKGSLADPTTVETLKKLEEQMVEEAKRKSASPSSQPKTETNPEPFDPNLLPGETEESEKGPGPWPWVVVGTGAAMTFTGAVLLGVGGGKISDAEVVCPNRVCPASEDSSDAASYAAALDAGNSGVRMQRIGTGVLGVGIAAIGGGLAWKLVAGPTTKSPGGREEARAGRWSFTPELAPGHFGLRTRVAF